MTADEDDAGLVLAFRKGDREAFALLIGRHRSRALGVARAVLGGDAWSAEDVAQEATYQAYFEVARLREPASFGAWLCGIVVNLARMSLRRSRYEMSLDDLAGGSYRYGLAAGEPTPEVAYEMEELRRRVQQALEVLPLKMRAAVWLHYVEGMTYQEVGVVTGIAPSTLRVLSHRARTRLREELAAEWAPRGRKIMADLVEVNVDIEVAAPKERQPGPLVGSWCVMLTSKTDGRRVRVFVGPYEGENVARQVTGRHPPRPQTYEFMGRLLEGAGATVERVVISDLVDDTFLATLTLRNGNRTTEIDARPSDAINMALRANAPLLVAAPLLERVGFAPDADPARAMFSPDLQWRNAGEIVDDLQQAQVAFQEEMRARRQRS